MDKIDVLKQFPFFLDAPPAERDEMLGVSTLMRFPARTFLFQEGDHCHDLLLVGEGKIRAFKSAESGRELTLYYVGAGECCILNISCLTSGSSCPATAQTETDVEAVFIPGEKFREWLLRCTTLRTYVFDLLAGHLAHVMSLVEEVAFKRMDRRLAEYLLAAGGKTNGGTGEVQATHEKIAVDLGSAREVVSRLLKEFERQGAVRLHRGRIELADPMLLRTFARDL